MQDFCFHASHEAAIIAALESLGLTTPDMDGNHRPVGPYCYVGQIVDQQGQYRINPDGTTTTIQAPTYHPGVYAVYRATDEQAAIIQAATLPDVVEIVPPPAGMPLFGGEWLAGVSLDNLKAARIAEATAVCDAVLAPLGVEYGRWETATWDQQYAEATALMGAPAASVPLITALAQARGMDVAVLAQRIIRNRETWSVLTGHVIGQRLAIVDRINAATTVVDVLAVPLSITLPG